jgi:hypothetical protein
MGETWRVPVHEDSKGLAMAMLGPKKSVRFSGGPVSQAVRLEVSLTVKSKPEGVSYQNLQVETFRQSPVGDLYANIRTQGLSALFPVVLGDPKPPAKPDDKSKPRRPNFGNVPSAK